MDRQSQSVEREFVEADGVIHLAHGEFTLCGDAFDLGSDEPGYEWKATKRRAVDCPRCADIILLCKGVRTRASHQQERDRD
jgi:hypothetical protein